MAKRRGLVWLIRQQLRWWLLGSLHRSRFIS
jgi:hypothetical protein